MQSSNASLNWSEIDQKAVDTARVLAMDAVQKCGNGHPGTAMSLAPAAYLLFQKVMRHDPTNPEWIGRDRFVLSCGHSSLTLYIQLVLGGFGLEIDDLKALRQWGSLTPGHPEYGHTAGVETTTGPLGQGIANAVGMAMAARRERGMLDPDTPAGESPFDRHVFAICSDGDVQEGISGEASSLAGHQQLGNLCVIYDDNHISIEDDTAVAFTEDVSKRYEAYGWHTQVVDWTAGGDYVEDVEELYAAIKQAQSVTDKPSFIRLRTLIAWPAPNAQNTGKAHGSALGEDEVAATKEILGLEPTEHFAIGDDVFAHTRELVVRGAQARAEWAESYQKWQQHSPDSEALLQRLLNRRLPAGWTEKLPTFEADEKGLATRAASGKVINAIAADLPELWGGSADLAGSNNTTINDASSFIPAEHSTDSFSGHPYGRVLHFGIREHAMGSTMNGMLAHGLTRPFGGTFLTFSDYMRPAVRLAALMQLPAIYVWTHDSIGVGEDGPTHQPIEHVAALRAIPGLDVVRPADANEVSAAWQLALEHNDRPTALCLTRQNVPTFPRGTDGYAHTDGVSKGGYTLLDSEGTPDVILIGTGSEVQLAVAAREVLAEQGVAARVVSMPCREWFDAQSRDYRDSVLPPTVTARVSVEAGIAMGWRDIIGDKGTSVSIEHYGASANGAQLFQEFGFTTDAVVEAATAALHN